MTFPDDLTAALTDAGWTPDRAVSTDEYERALQNAGFALLPPALDFLRCFGGLHVCHVDPASGTRHQRFVTDLEEAIEKTRACHADIEAALQRTICPIGTIHREQMALLIDNEGCFHVLCDGYLLHPGETAAIALAKLWSDTHFHEPRRVQPR